MVARDRGIRIRTETTVRHTKCGRMRGMVVGEGGRSSGVLLYCNVTLSQDTCTRLQHAVQKPGEFSLDLSEMRPVHIVTSIMCNLKRPL